MYIKNRMTKTWVKIYRGPFEKDAAERFCDEIKKSIDNEYVFDVRLRKSRRKGLFDVYLYMNRNFVPCYMGPTI